MRDTAARRFVGNSSSKAGLYGPAEDLLGSLLMPVSSLGPAEV